MEMIPRLEKMQTTHSTYSKRHFLYPYSYPLSLRLHSSTLFFPHYFPVFLLPTHHHNSPPSLPPSPLLSHLPYELLHVLQSEYVYVFVTSQLMAAGLRGRVGMLVLWHVGQRCKWELVRVPVQRLHMEVPVVKALEVIRNHVEQTHVQVSVYSNDCLSVLFCFKSVALSNCVWCKSLVILRYLGIHQKLISMSHIWKC